MQLATDVGPAPMNIGAVLILGTGPGFSPAGLWSLLSERIEAIPRLRQRLRRAPPGCGRPYWADDPDFDPGWHIREVRCPPPGDEQALLGLAAGVAGQALPWSRPLWAVRLVTGLATGPAALIIVMHHVLADGIGGLAVLAGLVDEGARQSGGGPPSGRFPAAPPSARVLAADAWAGRLRRLAKPGRGLRVLGQAAAELGATRPPRRLPRSSLNQRPTGSQRQLQVVTADLAQVRDLAHAHGGTVNDVVLAAVAGALRALLAGRGERLDRLQVSVAVSARAAQDGGQLGNQVGVMPVGLPTGGSLPARVAQIAVLTRQRKTGAPGSSAALLGPVFRLLAAAGVLRWYIGRQRLIHTLVTNLRGPAQQLTLGGAVISAVIPVSQTAGNVPVSFAVLSYAGVLRITVVSDPGRLPDAARLLAALRAELAEVSGGGTG